MATATAISPAVVGTGAPIEGRRITKRFPGKDKVFTAIEDVSFSIKGGEFDHGSGALGRVQRRAQRRAVGGVEGELGAAQQAAAFLGRDPHRVRRHLDE